MEGDVDRGTYDRLAVTIRPGPTTHVGDMHVVFSPLAEVGQSIAVIFEGTLIAWKRAMTIIIIETLHRLNDSAGTRRQQTSNVVSKRAPRSIQKINPTGE